MLVAPTQILAVRSNCRPSVTEKSPSKTTFDQGPGHPVGGAYSNSLGAKSSNLKLLKSCTTHGVVRGRRTNGSAVAVFGESISKSPYAAVPNVVKPMLAMTMRNACHLSRCEY